MSARAAGGAGDVERLRRRRQTKNIGATTTTAATTLHADERDSSISTGVRIRRTRSRRLPPVAATPSSGRRIAQFLERRERAGVHDAIGADGDDDVVAAELAFEADAPRQPPDGRVIEEQRLDRALEEIDQVVVPPDVRQLVRENRVELGRREAGQHARRNDNRRTDPADERGHVDE